MEVAADEVHPEFLEIFEREKQNMDPSLILAECRERIDKFEGGAGEKYSIPCLVASNFPLTGDFAALPDEVMTHIWGYLKDSKFEDVKHQLSTPEERYQGPFEIDLTLKLRRQ